MRSLALALAFPACTGNAPPPEAPPANVRAPVAPVLLEGSTEGPLLARRDGTTSTLFGQVVADPYRWLEDGNDPEVRAFVAAQNQRTRRALDALPERTKLKRRLEELLEIGQISVPVVRRVRADQFRYFFTRRSGKQNQPVLYARDGLNGPERVIVDPNALNPGGTTALDWYEPSNDGGLVAYGLSEGGSEESTLHVHDVKARKNLADVITRTRAAALAFTPDGKRFFYTRYPAEGSVPKGEEKYHRAVYEHTLGQPPERDVLIFGRDRPLTDYPGCALSPNGRWLLVNVHEGWNKTELFLADRSKSKLEFLPITSGKTNIYSAVVHDDVIYVHTNEGAPRYRVFALDPQKLDRSTWRPVITEHHEDVLASFDVIGKSVLAAYLEGPTTRLARFSLDGKHEGDITLPTVGTSDGFSGVHDGTEAFYNFESFAVPPRILRLDLHSKQSSTWQRVEANVRSDDYAVTTDQARSKDGTRVPYLLVHARAEKLGTGQSPTVLYGYGGFNVSVQPRFSRTNYALLERGVVFAQANLRGGGEFGEDWHRAGQLDKKQNVFDDYIAVAGRLVARRITSPSKLAVFGRSNGGLLVAAAITQRPELFRAAVSSVPLTDMVRYERFLIGKLWATEYGSADDAEQFKWLYAYSPYHRVRARTPYPAVLLTTAASDTRVDPLHARKMAAALQYATSSARPILLRTETDAGHGSGKPMSKVADEFADIYAFLLWQLGVVAPPPEQAPD